MRFVKESVIHANCERVFAFHEQPGALKLLIPPWETARVIQTASISELGAQAIIESRVWGPIKTQWIAEHIVYDPPYTFEDIQVAGPFQSWHHRHIVREHVEGAILRDEIEYQPPLGLLGRLVAPLLIQRRLERLFNYRHEVTRKWCERTDEG